MALPYLNDVRATSWFISFGKSSDPVALFWIHHSLAPKSRRQTHAFCKCKHKVSTSRREHFHNNAPSLSSPPKKATQPIAITFISIRGRTLPLTNPRIIFMDHPSSVLCSPGVLYTPPESSSMPLAGSRLRYLLNLIRRS